VKFEYCATLQLCACMYRAARARTLYPSLIARAHGVVLGCAGPLWDRAGITVSLVIE